MGRIRVGRPDVQHDTPTHVKGLTEGNHGPNHQQAGHNKDGTATARRSTGINPKRHDPILPIMPNLPPG